MKKTYPTSTKAKQWAKHLRPFGKRMANKSTRKINKADETETTSLMAIKKNSRHKFAIEYLATGLIDWKIWKSYITESGRNRGLENVIKKYGNSSFDFLKNYQFRKKDLK
jgi:hypothetical protein